MTTAINTQTFSLLKAAEIS